MPNLRIVTKNALRQASLTASSTAGNLAVSSLAAAVKSSLHRFTGTNGSYRATWAAPARIGCVALPFCNWSPTAKMRVRASTEGATTNLFRNSQRFENSSWVKTSISVQANVPGIVAPDGTETACKIVEGTGNSTHYFEQVTDNLVAGQPFAVSYFVKAAERSVVTIRFDGTSTSVSAGNAYFDTSTGTVRNIFGGATWTWTMKSFPGGWWRISAASVASASGVIRPRLCVVTGSTTITYAGDGASGYLLWGAQLELSPVATSYYPSVASAATRPAGYIDSWQSYDYDSGWVLACPAPAVELEGFTPAQAASAYAYGGGAYARHWLPQQLDATGLVVDIADPDNLQGYIEAACMVAGPVWSPRYNASGTSVSVIDRTEISRSAAGDQLADPGTLSRKVPVDLRAMPEEDRARFLDLVRNSRAHPILMSVFPEHPDLALERDFMVYGRRTKDSDVAYQFAGAYSTTLEIEEI